MAKNMLVISASAGSGKTYTLARTYIEHLLFYRNDNGKLQLRNAREYHQHILAITFTNKATEEMKERILRELYLLGKGQSTYLTYFQKECEPNSFANISQAAQRALKEILFNYAAFNVSTIDSFFQTILRTFAHELDQEMDYELQLNEKLATTIAVHSFMLDLGKENGRAEKWVRDLIADRMKANKNWNFFSKTEKLFDFAKNVNREDFRKNRDEIIKYLNDLGSGSGLSAIGEFQKRLTEVRKNCKEEYERGVANEFISILNSAGLTEQDLKGNASLLFLLKTGLDIDNNQPTSTIRNLTVDKIPNSFFKNTDQVAVEQVAQPILELTQKVVATFERYKFSSSLISNIWQFGLLGEINKKLEEYRKENNAILMADTNELIETALKSGAEFIYERVGARLNNLMIDEFQDTSESQYHNFHTLINETLARGNENLIIGDEKQCIYRFRNANPDLLRLGIQKDFPAYYCGTTLDRNFRSAENVIGFNNVFFSNVVDHFRALGMSSLAGTYSSIVQQLNKATGGYVRIQCMFNGTEEYPDKNYSRKEVLDSLPDYINGIRERGYSSRDILVLVNRRDEGADVVERLLGYNKELPADDPRRVNVVSAESLLLNNSPNVRLIISVLRFIDSTQYYASVTDILANDDKDKTPRQKLLERRLSQQRLYKVLQDFTSRLGTDDEPGAVLRECFDADAKISALSQQEQLEEYTKMLREILPDTRTELMSLVNIVDKIIDMFIIGIKGNTVETEFVLAFQSTVVDFVSKHNGGTVREFLRYWDEECTDLAIASPSTADAVNVMTIHKSKGLGAPCVIIPFCDWSLRRPDDIMWITREMWTGKNDLKAPIEGIDKDKNGRDIVPPLIPISTTVLKKHEAFQTYYAEQDELDVIDKINKTYVAFTRAKSELHLFCHPKLEFDPATSEIDDVSQLLRCIVPAMSPVCLVPGDNASPEVTPVIVTEELATKPAKNKKSVNIEAMTLYELGTPANHVVDDKGAVELVSMPPYKVNMGNSRIHVQLGRSRTVKQAEGDRLHFVMSRVTDYESLTAALDFAEQNKLLDDIWTRQRFESLLQSRREDPETEIWFACGNEVYNERQLYNAVPAADGVAVDNHRPDRILITPQGECIVIDYKFGTADNESLNNRYQQQVRGYMSLLSQVYNRTVTGYLWYLKPNRVVKVES